MTNQDHIDKIVNKLLKSRKMPAETIEAYASVIGALSQVPNPVVRENNEMSTTPNPGVDELFNTPMIPYERLSEINGIQIDGGERREIRIRAN